MNLFLSHIRTLESLYATYTIKDSIRENGVLHYKMVGYGDLPISDCFRMLKNNGYDGFISLEWTKRWNMELEDAGIVFSHFAYAVRRLWEKA